MKDKIDVKLVIRTLLQIVAMAYVAGQQFGLFADNVLGVIGTVAAVGISCYNFWMNNSFTPEAKAADIVMQFMKENKGITLSGIKVVNEEGDINE